MLDKLKPLLVIILITCGVLGWSYWNEAPYRAFRDRVMVDQAQVPFARVVGTGQSSDLGSPWSFIESRTHQIALASPDPISADRFRVVSFVFGQEEPGNYLFEVDCDGGSARWFGEGEAETASELARNYLGEPIVGPGGSPLVLIDAVPAPEQWKSSICEHNWNVEREALAQRLGRQSAP